MSPSTGAVRCLLLACCLLLPSSACDCGLLALCKAFRPFSWEAEFFAEPCWCDRCNASGDCKVSVFGLRAWRGYRTFTPQALHNTLGPDKTSGRHRGVEVVPQRMQACVYTFGSQIAPMIYIHPLLQKAESFSDMNSWRSDFMNTREGCLPSPSPCKYALHRQY